jgi:hypothetical protein
MKKIIMLITIVFSILPIRLASEIIFKVSYEQLSKKIYYLDLVQTYNNGVWQSMSFSQNNKLAKYGNPFLWIGYRGLCFSSIILGYEVGFGIDIEQDKRKYNIPIYSPELSGDITSPAELPLYIDEYASKEIDIANRDYYLYPRLVIGAILKKQGPINIDLEIGFGPRITLRRSNYIEITKYERAREPYNISDRIFNKTIEYSYSLLPEGSIGISILFSGKANNHSIGIYGDVSFGSSGFQGTEEYDLHQVDPWPAPLTLSSYEVGSEYIGLRFSAGIKMRIK